MGLPPISSGSSSSSPSASSGSGANGSDGVDSASRSSGTGNGQGGDNTSPPSTVVRLGGRPHTVQAGGSIRFGGDAAGSSSSTLPSAAMKPADPCADSEMERVKDWLEGRGGLPKGPAPSFDPPDLLGAAIEELEQVQAELEDDLVILDAAEAARSSRKGRSNRKGHP